VGDRKIIISGKIYNNLYHVFLDGYLLEPTDYTLRELTEEDYENGYDFNYEEGGFLISWNSDSDIFKENSILIIDFYSNVKGVQHECNIDTVFVNFMNDLRKINSYRKDRFPEFYLNTETHRDRDDFWRDNIDIFEPDFDPFNNRVNDTYWYEYMFAIGKTSHDD